MRLKYRIITLLLLLCSICGAKAKGENIIDIAQLISNEEYSKAKPLLNRYLARNPEDDMAWYYLSFCLWNERDYKGSIDCLERAKELDPSNPEYYETLYSAVDVLFENSGVSDSLALEMMAKFPNKYSNPYFLTVLAQSEFSSHKDSLALEHLNTALEKDPTSLMANGLLLDYYLSKSDFSTVFNILPLIVSHPDVDVESKARVITDVVNSMRGSQYRIFQKRVDEICDLFIHMHPKDEEPYVLAGSWYEAKGDKAEAERIYRNYAEIAPDSLMSWLNLDMLFMDDADKRESILMEALEHISDKKDRASIYASLANLYYYSTPHKKKGMDYFEKAYKADPENAMILNNYAYALSLENKNLKKAKRLSQKSLEYMPEEVAFLDTYAYILYLRGEYEEAKKYFKKALVYGGKEDKSILEHYALTLEALGETDLAEYYRNLAKDK
ncbi:MAG: tetratricopeptide repeat protein [Candidatus Cryptobacteroides sp.]